MRIRFSRRQVLAGAVGAAVTSGVANATSNHAEYFEITETELPIAGLDPAHEGLRIAQISDLHVGMATPDGRIYKVVREINRLKPDLVLLTGDYLTHSADPLPRVPLVLHGIDAPTFAVLGNHDHYVDAAGVRKGIERIGYTVLQNEHTVVRIRNAPLTVLGVDDGRTGSDDVAKTFAGAPRRGTRIVLAHTPPTAEKLPENAGLACFSGHTHGGQVALIPGLTEAVFARAGQPYVRGLYQVNGNHLYVNRGLGFGRGSIFARINSEPELSMFTLRCAPKS
ncbi:MAG: metallophosphoesterase [Myxococcaceae bacterium]|nr:metallophosphoesterase [Myxococcaceae bacterium]